MSLALAVLVAMLAAVLPAAQTLDETFGGTPITIGSADSGWGVAAADLVGTNCGSFFFDVSFDTPLPPKDVMRTIATLRTGSRLTLSFASFGNAGMRFSFSNLDRTYVYDFPDKLAPGEVHVFGVTWDGEAVRVYYDGRCLNSGAQPLTVKSVTKLFLGPYKDGYHDPRIWADDVHISRLRIWNTPRTSAEVAAEAGVELRPLAETHPPFLAIPQLPASAGAPVIDGSLDETAWTYAGSMPQLIRADQPGKSGEMPSHGFRLASDASNLYCAVTTVLPGRISYVEGEARTPTSEPDVRGSESWELHVHLGGHRYRFAANVAGGTTEGLDGDDTWDGAWTYRAAQAMQIDDSVIWTCEMAIPWTTLGLSGAPAAGTEGRFNVCRTWTLSTLACQSSLDGSAPADYAFSESWPTFRLGSAASYRADSRTDPAEGDYTEGFSLTADRSSKIGYSIELARQDGAYEPMSIYSRELTLAADETRTDSITASTAVPGYDVVLHTVTQGGQVVMRQALPYDLIEKVATVTPFYLRGFIRVAFQKLFSGTIRLTDADGGTISETATDGADVEIPFDRNSAAGDYGLLFVNAAGETNAEKRLSYPGVGDWAHQDFHEDWILPPFTPMTSEVAACSLDTSLFGRTYSWNKSFLPTQIVSLDEPLLAQPAEILVDGAAVAATAFAVTSNRPHHVGFAATGGQVSSAGWLEYDGVQFNRVTVTPTGKGLLQVRYRLKPAFAKYLHCASGSGWGAKVTARVADGASSYGSYTTMWTGNEEKGLCFFYETRSNWTAVAKTTYALEKTDEGLTVTVNVTKSLPAGEPFTFEFGLLATPMRPLSKRYPFDTLSESHYSPLNRPDHRPFFDVSLLSADDSSGGDLGSFFGDQDTPDGRKTDANIKYIIRNYEVGNGSRPIPYTCANYLSVRYPEVAAYIPEWTFSPEVAMDYSNTGHYVYECCPTTAASDFFVWKYKSMLARYPELKGVYFDFGTIHSCENADHGCNGRTPILAEREYFRRIIVAQIEAGIEDPVIVLHNTDCVQPPAMSFATHLLNGENVRQASSSILHDKKDILDTYGYEMFACELSTLPWGIANSIYMPFDRLSEANGGDETTAAYKFRMGKASLGPALLHNTMQSPWRNHPGLFDKILRHYEAFGVDRAKFVGYWRKPVAVTGADDVEVSCYAKGDKVLAVIAQIGKEHHDQDIELVFDWAKLGLTNACCRRAVDKMTEPDPDYQWYVDHAKAEYSRTISSRLPTELGEFGTRIDGFDGKTLKYHLPFHTFGIVELTAGCAHPYVWSDKSGEVTVTRPADVMDEDLAFVTNLTGVVLEGAAAALVFTNETVAATVGFPIRGDGRIVKRGAADVVLRAPATNSTETINAQTFCTDFFTTGGIRVERGTLSFDQTSTRLFWYGPLTVEEGATLVTSPFNHCGCESLDGAGSITNTSPRVTYNYTPAVPKKWDNGCNIIIGRYGSQNHSLFTGRIDGFIGLQVCSEVHLTNPNSTFFGDISIDVPYYTNPETKSGQLHINGFGSKGRGSSPSGGGDCYLYGMEFTLNYGGKVFYCGEGGETTDKRFRWNMTYDYGAGYETLDAGHAGGVTFTGQWSNNSKDRMNGIVLAGSNTADMVLANNLNCGYGDGTNGLWSLKKTGTGSWRVADHPDRAKYFAAWFVEEGTLKYDSIADIGEACALGLATQCFPFQKHTPYATARAEANRLPYEIELGGGASEAILEYSGTGSCTNNDRRIGLVGTGGTLSSGSNGGAVALYGGILSADGQDKTLTLAGANAKPSVLGDVGDDGAARLSLVKTGAGEWRLARNVRLTGDLDVREGTLTVAPEEGPKNYKWYRLTVTKLGKAHAVDAETGLEDMAECVPSSYYVRLRGIALYTADGTIYTPTMEDLIPWDNMDDEQKTGEKSYRYPTGWWQNLEPGQITIGDYTGNQYRTYPNNTLKHLFSNLTKASHTVYTTYLGCTPGPNNKNAWLPIVFRLPDDAPTIAYYDLLADHDSAYQKSSHVATWQVEGSDDGRRWTKLHEITECAHTKQDCWASTGTNAVKWTLGANCLTQNRGYRLQAQYETDLSEAASVRVARGATLRHLADASRAELPQLTVDCAGAGMATVRGFQFAASGALSITNAPKDLLAVPVDFVNCTGLGNLPNWALQVNGEGKAAGARVKGGKLYIGRRSSILIVK